MEKPFGNALGVGPEDQLGMTFPALQRRGKLGFCRATQVEEETARLFSAGSRRVRSAQ